ncbi:hypothetical protein Ddye_009443 [Dipteronia dyeriana]|uniref:Uncharacterized protein n=1 Tax=Dipteronia dyeriana TaxID=168575 RepID=A0AAD9XC08_9ROSI|nr:hypothetical protein Ddye_009443 [Dipteronia dyeriana]
MGHINLVRTTQLTHHNSFINTEDVEIFDLLLLESDERRGWSPATMELLERKSGDGHHCILWQVCLDLAKSSCRIVAAARCANGINSFVTSPPPPRAVVV